MEHIEYIQKETKIIAIIIRNEAEGEGAVFVSPHDFSQQLGINFRPGDYQIKPHIHNIIGRNVTVTQEVLFLARGKIRVDLYDDDGHLVAERILLPGDVIQLAGGGHGITFLEDSKLIEVKQGPYARMEDKYFI
jgi:hypothetical protein